MVPTCNTGRDHMFKMCLINHLSSTAAAPTSLQCSTSFTLSVKWNLLYTNILSILLCPKKDKEESIIRYWSVFSILRYFSMCRDAIAIVESGRFDKFSDRVDERAMRSPLPVNTCGREMNSFNADRNTYHKCETLLINMSTSSSYDYSDDVRKSTQSSA